MPLAYKKRNLKTIKSRIDLKSYEHNLGFVIGLNKTDFSYGWYGNMHGLHMYYNYFTDQGETKMRGKPGLPETD